MSKPLWKRVLTSLVIWVAMLVLFGGCTNSYTSKLWEDPKEYDSITHFLVTSQGGVIFASTNYHYMFEGVEPLVDVLNWPENNVLTAHIPSQFHLKKDNEILGSLLLTTKQNKLSPSQVTWLKKRGFKKQSGSKSYSLNIDLRGERYLSNNLELDSFGRLNDKFSVWIARDRTFQDNLTSAALTPIMATLEGTATVLVLGAGMGAVILNPCIAMSCQRTK